MKKLTGKKYEVVKGVNLSEWRHFLFFISLFVHFKRISVLFTYQLFDTSIDPCKNIWTLKINCF